jgi:drug/metabolite transporter (DMT)-like permease
MWYFWIVLSFITNGVAQFGVRIMQEMNLAETHTFLYLAFWFLAGLVVGILIYWLTPQRPPIRGVEIMMGLFLSVSSAACWFFMSAAFVHEVPAYLALPVATCGSISLVTVVGILFFKERLSVYGYLGMFASLVGIALSISG